MDEYTVLAQQIALSVGDVRGCLILSRDGLVLGAFPPGDESVAKPAWIAFAALGEPQRSFVEFPDQVWGFVHAGAYAVFAVAAGSIRPGLLMDHMEQALLAAAEARTRRDALQLGDQSPVAPSGKPRTSLHPSAPEPTPTGARQARPAKVAQEAGSHGPVDPVVVTPAPDGVPGARAGGGRGGDGGHRREETSASGPVDDDAATAGTHAGAKADPDGSGRSDRTSERPEQATTPPPMSHFKREPHRLMSSSEDDDDEGEIDRVMLAKEFSGLLQMNEDADDAGA